MEPHEAPRRLIHMRTSALLVALAIVTTACGSSSGGALGSDSTTTVEQNPQPEETPVSVEACGLSDPWSMVETAFVATVSEVERRVNEQRQFNLEEHGLDA